MIKISLGKLETARTNPALIAQSILSQEGGKGGNPGFVGSWKTVVRSYHENKETQSLAMNKLSEKFLITFNPTKENREKSARFCDSFNNYCTEFTKLGLGIDTFQINLNWEILKQSVLTGHSPFLCSNETHNIAYFFQERSNDWQNQLKYPLLQIYLSEKFYKCDVDKVKIGIYNIVDKKFELKTYEDFELDNSLEEAKTIFKNVKLEYDKF